MSRCQYVFSWDNDKRSEVGKYGDVRHSTNPLGDKVTTFEHEGICLREHRCIRETIDGSDFCVWHAESPQTKESYSFPQEDRSEPIVDANLSGSSIRNKSLDSLSLFWPNFSSTQLDRVNFSKSILFHSDFTNSTITGVDFENSVLNFANFENADIGSDTTVSDLVTFREADCRGTEFANANFCGDISFSKANFDKLTTFARNMEGINFERCDLSDVDAQDIKFNNSDFSKTELSRANFTNCAFRNVDFTDSMAFDAKFSEGCDLERANFQRANLQTVLFEDAELHSAVFTDAIVDHETAFDSVISYEKEAIKSNKIGDKIENLNRAIWVYRRLSDLHHANSQSTTARNYYIAMKDSLRKRRWIELCGVVNPRFHLFGIGKSIFYAYEMITKTDIPNDRTDDLRYYIRLWNVVKSELSKWIIGYGESWKNILWSLGTVSFIYSIFYTITGLNTGDDPLIPESITFPLLGTLSFPEILQKWIVSLYFSVVTFTTLGYGDIQPEGIATYIAASEAVIGSSLMALLVFVLGRRATW